MLARRQIRAGTERSTTNSPALLILAAGVLLVASLYLAQAVLIPIALSILITFLLSPVVDAAERTGLGRVPSVVLIGLLVFSVLGAIGWLVTLQITSVVRELPNYQENIRKKIVELRGAGEGGIVKKVQTTLEQFKGEIQTNEVAQKSKKTPVLVRAEEPSIFWPLTQLIGPLTERLATAGLVIVLVIFMLIERDELRNRLIRLAGYSRMTTTTRALEEAGQRISRYMLMQSLINGTFGIAVGVGLFLIGLPYALLWGFLAAALRFIPYLGIWLALILPTAVSLAVFDAWIWPIAVVGLFLGLELLIYLVVEPLLFSESAGLSKAALLMAVAFWTWLWGPVGLLLATPMTSCLVVLGKHVPQFGSLAILLGDEPVMEKEIAYYQRLLAMDQDEALEIAEEYLKTNPSERIYDDVFVPALNYAKRDRDLGKLTEEAEEFVYRATQQILEELEDRQRQNLAPSESDVGGNSSASRSKLRVVACPARDEADETALLMFKQLIALSLADIEILPHETLTSEVMAQVAKDTPDVVCIAALLPGGVAQARYLCKRLRAQFPQLKIMVGRWGDAQDVEKSKESLHGAGADRIAATLLGSRGDLNQLRLRGL